MAKVKVSIATLYREISKGEQRTHACLRRLVATCNMVDHTCPDRPISPLLDIQNIGLTPAQINMMFYNICKGDPFKMHVLLYGSIDDTPFDILNRCDLHKSLKAKGRGINIPRTLLKLRQFDRHFGQYYNPKLKR